MFKMKNPNFFGIRHLSPAGAYYLREFLDEKKPKLVLVEGPSDFEDLLSDMVREETKPPIAVLAYTHRGWKHGNVQSPHFHPEQSDGNISFQALGLLL